MTRALPKVCVEANIMFSINKLRSALKRCKSEWRFYKKNSDFSYLPISTPKRIQLELNSYFLLWACRND